MSQGKHGLVKALFLQAVALSEEERERFLAAECADNASLRQEVETLLAYHDTETILPPPEEDSGTVLKTLDVDTPPALAQSILSSDQSLDAEDETRNLLRFRLRAVTLVLAVAIAYLMAADILMGRWVQLGMHSVGAAVMCSCLALLSSHIPLTLRTLRIAELVTLATIGLLAIMIDWWLMVTGARWADAAQTINANNWSYLGWSLIIMIYGVFMPNHWQRAALILVPAASVPYLVTATVCWWDSGVHAILANEERFGTLLPAPFVAALTSVYAAHIIHSSRLDAIRAKQFAQYRLTRLLGAGGMGEVYEAEHLLLKRPCAIKLIRRERSTDAKMLARFEREVQATAHLSHPNTIEVFDYGRTEEGRFYYVMELLPGMSLQDLVDQYGPLSPGRVVYLLRQCCGALQEAHDAGLIHRDIKPANIIAAERGGMYDVVKVLDFGLVRETRFGAKLSGMHTLAGTPQYMAPEQALASSAVDARTDLYALGATAYFLLTGRPPFGGTNPVEILLKHTHDTTFPPSHYLPTIPAEMDQIIMRCLEKAAADRYQSASELSFALEQTTCHDAWTAALAKDWWQERDTPPTT
ncbi:MAG TPA: serine/threonine protein kinase [Planctomycetaceae bacterium]|nr:serine/threonine protein kinase [Blastopirellula sp.]HAY80780.1 serine/threonine protein kinase [Planctomycetaceae bacterium]